MSESPIEDDYIYFEDAVKALAEEPFKTTSLTPEHEKIWKKFSRKKWLTPKQYFDECVITVLECGCDICEQQRLRWETIAKHVGKQCKQCIRHAYDPVPIVPEIIVDAFDDRFIGIKLGLASQKAFRMAEWTSVNRQISMDANRKRLFLFDDHSIASNEGVERGVPSYPFSDKYEQEEFNYDDD
jgi:hypothetical protein